MVGEFLREAAVLVLVFVPLDLAVREKFSGAGLAGAVVISAGLRIGGYHTREETPQMSELIPWAVLGAYGLALFVFALLWDARERAQARKRQQSSTTD